MITVPGSIPNMIFSAVCNVKFNFTVNRLLEQKYQINYQLPAGPFAVCVVVMDIIQKNPSSA